LQPRPLAAAAYGTVNETLLLSVIVDMTTTANTPRGRLPADADAAIRELYFRYADALHGYAARFCHDSASADDIVQETFIRAWRHLPQLTADGRPIRPWLFRVARNLLIDADRAARALGIPDGTARSRLHYALRSLRRQLRDRDAIAC
jgi:DNA-directed RNA polymerase specialized sigma24 family protein